MMVEVPVPVPRPVMREVVMDRHVPVPQPMPMMQAPMPMMQAPMMQAPVMQAPMSYSTALPTASYGQSYGSYPTYGATSYGGYGAATTYGASYPATTVAADGTPVPM